MWEMRSQCQIIQCFRSQKHFWMLLTHLGHIMLVERSESLKQNTQSSKALSVIWGVFFLTGANFYIRKQAYGTKSHLNIEAVIITI